MEARDKDIEIYKQTGTKRQIDIGARFRETFKGTDNKTDRFMEGRMYDRKYFGGTFKGTNKKTDRLMEYGGTDTQTGRLINE